MSIGLVKGQVQYFQHVSIDELDWGNVELQISDSSLIQLISTSENLRGLYKNKGSSMLRFCHPIDLGTDFKIDILFYWPTSLGEQLILYKNDGLKLTKSFEQFITLNEVQSNINASLITIRGISGFQEISPESNLVRELSIAADGLLIQQDMLWYIGTKVPSVLNLRIPIKIINDKYRMRATPFIDPTSANVICELATSDTGTVLAESIDDTGRKWWFVLMNNNISKDKSYFHFDSNSEAVKNMRLFGWISSSFVHQN